MDWKSNWKCLALSTWYFINNLQLYLCKSIADYEFFKITGPYLPVTDLLTLQTSNSEGFWITDLIHDNFEKNISLGKVFGNSGGENLYFGGYYYLNNGNVCLVHGGGFDHHIRCNITTVRGQVSSTTKWYLYGGRLIYKPL